MPSVVEEDSAVEVWLVRIDGTKIGGRDLPEKQIICLLVPRFAVSTRRNEGLLTSTGGGVIAMGAMALPCTKWWNSRTVCGRVSMMERILSLPGECTLAPGDRSVRHIIFACECTCFTE